MPISSIEDLMPVSPWDYVEVYCKTISPSLTHFRSPLISAIISINCVKMILFKPIIRMSAKEE